MGWKIRSAINQNTLFLAFGQALPGARPGLSHLQMSLVAFSV